MKLADLKSNVEETLGMDVISFKSLVVCANNCISILHTKEYREFKEAKFPITLPHTYPLEVDTPTDMKQILSLKIKTKDGIFVIPRTIISNPALGARVVNGVPRLQANQGAWVFYEKLGKIYIDTMSDTVEVEEVILGYYKTIPKLSMSLTEDSLLGNDTVTPAIPQAEIDVRQDFEDAFTWYGLKFYADRFKLRPEITKEYNDQFRYFVEDMANQLDKEDYYYENNMIHTDQM